ncbi:hypothetical protein [Massilia putida]|uniref:hypothetical protein n=1 Tax=Massilia putida TaxID=1141883 RepID=UPI0012EC46D3|nr:hypothetical protein [Massilia putida]
MSSTVDINAGRLANAGPAYWNKVPLRVIEDNDFLNVSPNVTLSVLDNNIANTEFGQVLLEKTRATGFGLFRQSCQK